MSAPPDDRVEVAALAAEGAGAERRYALDQFPRLADMLAGPEGEAEARFRFIEAAAGVAGCELEVKASVTLRCERCLDAYVEALRSTTRLAFMVEGAESGAPPEGFEALTVPRGLISLRELVEDELLLAMPIVPRHGEGAECAGRGTAAAGRVASPPEETRRPFAGLQDLLKH